MTYEQVIFQFLSSSGPQSDREVVDYVWKLRPSPKGYQTTLEVVTSIASKSKYKTGPKAGERMFKKSGDGVWSIA